MKYLHLLGLLGHVKGEEVKTCVDFQCPEPEIADVVPTNECPGGVCDIGRCCVQKQVAPAATCDTYADKCDKDHGKAYVPNPETIECADAQCSDGAKVCCGMKIGCLVAEVKFGFKCPAGQVYKPDGNAFFRSCKSTTCSEEDCCMVKAEPVEKTCADFKCQFPDTTELVPTNKCTGGECDGGICCITKIQKAEPVPEEKKPEPVPEKKPEPVEEKPKKKVEDDDTDYGLIIGLSVGGVALVGLGAGLYYYKVKMAASIVAPTVVEAAAEAIAESA